MTKPFLLLILALAIRPIAHCIAQPVSTPHIVTELIAEEESITAGHPFHLALRLEMEKEWHTYWQNPGDAGLPTTIEWDMPEGFIAGPIRWPYPHQFGQPPEVSYGYENSVLLPVEITPPATLRPGDTVTIRGRAEWLVCREICLKGKADLVLRLVVTNRSNDARNPQWSNAFRQTYAMIPQKPAGLKINAQRAGKEYILSIIRSNGADLALQDSVTFFPSEESVIDHSGEQKLAKKGATLLITLPVSPYASEPARRLRGVLVAHDSQDKQRTVKAIEIDVVVEDSDG